MAEKFELIENLGRYTKLMKNKNTGELVAVKFITREGHIRVGKNVEREILNHRSLYHPNIICFKEVYLTPQYLAIVMEYADGGELFERISKAGCFNENDARFLFQQLISGVYYRHKSGVCRHRDLNFHNTFLAAPTDGSNLPEVKICPFITSSRFLLHHALPKSTKRTPAYIAPEVFKCKEYKGEVADVWSCGVTLYVMLVGAYPFEDPQDPLNCMKYIKRIVSVTYTIPASLKLSEECVDLLRRIFVADPTQRLDVEGVIAHPWFQRNMPDGLKAKLSLGPQENPCEQTESDIAEIVAQAGISPEGADDAA